MGHWPLVIGGEGGGKINTSELFTKFVDLIFFEIVRHKRY